LVGSIESHHLAINHISELATPDLGEDFALMLQDPIEVASIENMACSSWCREGVA